MTRRRGVSIAVALVLIVAPLLAQTTFKSGVEAVRLDVSVMRDGRPVRGLTAGDFIVTDNDVPQRLESALLESAPLNVVMALDTSGSVMGNKLAHLIEAATGIATDLRDRDRAALITFSEQVERRVPLTGERRRLVGALTSLSGNGATALRDGVMASLSIREDDDHRTVLLVFSDGRDTSSWLSERNLLDATRRGSAIVHAIEISEQRSDSSAGFVPQSPGSSISARPAPPELASDPSSFLKELTRAAGGRYWRTAQPEELGALFRMALDEMRTRYELTFYPPVPNRPGWHRVEVRLKRGSATIAARPGYLVESSRP